MPLSIPVLGLTGLLVLGAETGERKAPLPPEVQRAEALIGDGKFEEAVRALQVILKKPEADPAVLAETYRLMGLAALYLGRADRARQAYELLLEVSPAYELPESTPPKVRTLVESVRKGRQSATKKP